MGWDNDVDFYNRAIIENHPSAQCPCDSCDRVRIPTCPECKHMPWDCECVHKCEDCGDPIVGRGYSCGNCHG